MKPMLAARRRVVILAFLLGVITYLDRVCISAAAPAMSRDLGLSEIQMGYVFSVFALAYALFEIPSGWLGDRIGQRKVLTRIVAGWSVFTMLTGAVSSYGWLLVTRFLFGAGEAGAFPNLARALARWFPVEQRARAQGLMWMGARVGGSIAPPLAALLVTRIGWRQTFVVFGLTGLVWCAAFWRWYRDDPAGVEPSLAAPVVPPPMPPAPWVRIFTNGSLWALFWMYLASAYGFWFFVTWMPTYLMREHGLSMERSGSYSALPLAAGAIGCGLGGLFADWLAARTGSVKWSRRAIGLSGYFLAAVGFSLAASSRDALSATLWLSFAEFAHDMTISVVWASVVDIGGRFGGTTSGFMNIGSSVGAVISPLAAAWLNARFGSFTVMIASAAAVYVAGGSLWLLIDPASRVEGANASPRAAEARTSGTRE